MPDHVTKKIRDEYREWEVLPPHIGKRFEFSLDEAIALIRELTSTKACAYVGNYCTAHGIRTPRIPNCPHERATEYLRIVDEED